ncbi:MAG TPA: hypothetical protein VFN61_09935 [Acidimicrobiales bacterium]|nr:hypothetical protein [Acidimicrobiales bacterium]
MVQLGAKITRNGTEAARMVASGTPVVLITETGGPTDSVQASADAGCPASPPCDPPGLVAMMIGPGGPELEAAAAEMAGELFVWARRSSPPAP